MLEREKNTPPYFSVSLVPLAIRTFEVQTNESNSPFIEEPFSSRKLYRIANHHHRSLEDRRVDKKVIWSDEYGVLFGARSIKGYPLIDPHLEFDETYPYKIRVYGLKDNLGVDRIQQASLYMRKHGLATERVVRIKVLKELPFKGRVISVDEWKDQVLQNPPALKDSKGNLIPSQTIAEYLNLQDFYVLEREYQIGERLRDFYVFNHHIDTFVLVKEDGSVVIGDYNIKLNNIGELKSRRQYILEEFIKLFEESKAKGTPISDDFAMCIDYLEFELDNICKYVDKNSKRKGIISSGYTLRSSLKEIFQWVNTVNKISSDIVPKDFDANKDEDIERYFVNYLPFQMGEYLAVLHFLGLAHHYPQAHNWSGVGTLLDLDSVHGEPLGDIGINEKDKKRDRLYGMAAIREYLSYDRRKVYAKGESAIWSGYLRQIFGKRIEEMREKAVSNFLVGYFETREDLIIKFLKASGNKEAVGV